MQQMRGVKPGEAAADNGHLSFGDVGHLSLFKEAWAKCLNDGTTNLWSRLARFLRQPWELDSPHEVIRSLC